MRPEDYNYLYDLEENFWWFAGMREITRSLLASEPSFAAAPPPLRILDAGCGTGGMLEWFEANTGGRVFGIDLVTDALRFARERRSFRLAQASATHLPFASESFDLVTSFDVLVQLPRDEDARQALTEMIRVLRPGGTAFVRVAAYGWMRSGHDRALSTARRYSLPALRSEMRQAGFQITRATYANMWLLPAAMAHRLVLKPLGVVNPGSDVKPFAPGREWLNRVMTTTLRSEARLLGGRLPRLPCGLSAIAIGRKPDA